MTTMTPRHAWTFGARGLRDCIWGGSADTAYDFERWGDGSSEDDLTLSDEPINDVFPDGYGSARFPALDSNRGIRTSADFTAEVLAALAAGRTVCFLGAVRRDGPLDVSFPHPMFQFGHNASDGPVLLRVTCAGQTGMISLYIGEGDGARAIRKDLDTAANIGFFGGNTVFAFVQLTPNDASLSSNYRHNARLSVMSIDANGDEVYALTTVEYLTTATGSEVERDLAVPFGLHIGQGITQSGHLAGMCGGMLYTERADADFYSDAEVEELMLSAWAEIAGAEPQPSAVHAWTGEPAPVPGVGAGFLRDVAMGGTFDLVESGSGSALAGGIAAMAGLAARWRGITVGASGAKYMAAPAGFTDRVEADLAAGRGCVFRIAMERPGGALTGALRSILEIGSTSAGSLVRIRQSSTNNLDVAIGEGSSVVTLTVGAIADIWPSQTGTLLVSVQVTNDSADHDGETHQQQVVVDTLHVQSLTRTRAVLYADGAPASTAMRTTTSDQMTLGANVSGAGLFGGTIAAHYSVIEPGASGAELWAQEPALENLYGLFVDGVAAGIEGDAARFEVAVGLGIGIGGL